jgi:hypothetical protein
VPVWHEATREWVKQGRLAVVAVIQEQHPERCRLFAQWKGFDWPILHDPINVLNATAVPLFIAIDQHGIVRSTRAQLDNFESSFLDREFTDDAKGAVPARLTPPRTASDPPSDGLTAAQFAQAWRQRGDSLAIWRGDEHKNPAIRACENALKHAPNDLLSSFRLGVCLRMRYESQQRQDGDFARAVVAWETALAGRPNQYIWRRRIQQFGPRLIKPYPFYDWVTIAEMDIRQRGDEPVQLVVRPTGAEVAAPAKKFVTDAVQDTSPDPNGKIRLDTLPLIQTTVTVVPSVAAAGSTARVHLTFIPNAEHKTHWNNEVEPLQLWIDAPRGGGVERQLLSGPTAAAAESVEVRRLDAEVQLPKDAVDSVQLDAYALYYVCEDVAGVCQYLRKDIKIVIPVASK